MENSKGVTGSESLRFLGAATFRSWEWWGTKDPEFEAGLSLEFKRAGFVLLTSACQIPLPIA